MLSATHERDVPSRRPRSRAQQGHRARRPSTGLHGYLKHLASFPTLTAVFEITNSSLQQHLEFTKINFPKLEASNFFGWKQLSDQTSGTGRAWACQGRGPRLGSGSVRCVPEGGREGPWRVHPRPARSGLPRCVLSPARQSPTPASLPVTAVNGANSRWGAQAILCELKCLEKKRNGTSLCSLCEVGVEATHRLLPALPPPFRLRL